MLLVVLLFIALAQGVRSGFQQSDFTKWRDCGVGDSWVSVKQFDFRPDPFFTNLEFTTSFDAIITHSIADQVTMDVLVEKQLLGRYTKVPCTSDMGTCHYTDPCHFLNAYNQHGTCPPQLTANGIPCTCPFNPDKLSIPMTKFSLNRMRGLWRDIFYDAEFHLKITINEN
ncbi:ganglioside GM2 activator-like isoform X1 [Haliotis rubra]|uniref:ganglioside GM2 activator-like isoform X1 n=1 Tax=Haliotis rubra TaxID=36100 RepID=UPI001EE58468|nr:ganglioside GM2 activator-like isoform X1 [Haliotis rubra]